MLPLIYRLTELNLIKSFQDLWILQKVSFQESERVAAGRPGLAAVPPHGQEGGQPASGRGGPPQDTRS